MRWSRYKSLIPICTITKYFFIIIMILCKDTFEKSLSPSPYTQHLSYVAYIRLKIEIRSDRTMVHCVSHPFVRNPNSQGIIQKGFSISESSWTLSIFFFFFSNFVKGSRVRDLKGRVSWFNYNKNVKLCLYVVTSETECGKQTIFEGVAPPFLGEGVVISVRM